MNLKFFKNKNFSFLILGKFISLLGTSFQDFALSLYVLKITGSGTKFASVFAVALIPQLILGPVAGVLVDWFDRKKTIIILDILSFLTVASGCIVYMLSGSLSMTHIYGIVITLSIISIIFSSSSTAIIPSLLKKEDLSQANSLNSLVQSVCSIAGPLLSGIIYGFYGLLPVLALNAVSFLISAIFESIVNIPKSNKSVDAFSYKQFKMDFKEGVSFILKNRIMVVIVIIGFVLNFAITPLFCIGWTYTLKQIIKISDFQLGIAESVLGFGMILGALCSSYVIKKINFNKLVSLSFVIISFIILTMSFIISPTIINILGLRIFSLISFVVLNFLIVAITVVSNVTINTLFQSITPLDMMGRVSSVLGTVCMAAIPLGQMIFGALFDIIPAYFNFIIVSIIVILVAIYSIIFLRNTKESNLVEDEAEICN